MDPIWIRRHPRPPVRPTQPPPHDTQVATAVPRTTPMGDPPAAGPHVRPAFLWIPLSRASQDGEDGEKPRRRAAGQASPGGAMDGGEEGERRMRLEGRRLGFSPSGCPRGVTRGELS